MRLFGLKNASSTWARLTVYFLCSDREGGGKQMAATPSLVLKLRLLLNKLVVEFELWIILPGVESMKIGLISLIFYAKL